MVRTGEQPLMLTPDEASLLRETILEIRNARGVGRIRVAHGGGTGLIIGESSMNPRRAGDSDGWIDAFLTGATEYTTSHRWEYDFSEAVFVAPSSGAPHDGWTVKTGGITGKCYNLAEVGHDKDVGPDNIDKTDLPGTYEHQNLNTSSDSTNGRALVRLRKIGGKWWFTREIGIDGAC